MMMKPIVLLTLLPMLMGCPDPKPDNRPQKTMVEQLKITLGEEPTIPEFLQTDMLGKVKTERGWSNCLDVSPEKVREVDATLSLNLQSARTTSFDLSFLGIADADSQSDFGSFGITSTARKEELKQLDTASLFDCIDSFEPRQIEIVNGQWIGNATLTFSKGLKANAKAQIEKMDFAAKTDIFDTFEDKSTGRVFAYFSTVYELKAQSKTTEFKTTGGKDVVDVGICTVSIPELDAANNTMLIKIKCGDDEQESESLPFNGNVGKLRVQLRRTSDEKLDIKVFSLKEPPPKS